MCGALKHLRVLVTGSLTNNCNSLLVFTFFSAGVKNSLLLGLLYSLMANFVQRSTLLYWSGEILNKVFQDEYMVHFTHFLSSEQPREPSRSSASLSECVSETTMIGCEKSHDIFSTIKFDNPLHGFSKFKISFKIENQPTYLKNKKNKMYKIFVLSRRSS